MAMHIAAFPPVSSRSQSDTEDTEGEANMKRNRFEQAFAEQSSAPFKLQRTFGINPAVPVINLATENRALLAYACSHVAVIYDYDSKEMLPLLGHQNAVRTLSTTRDGKWLLTADFGQDCAVVVWDTEEGIPVCTLNNPHGNEDMTAARISPNAEHIVTIGNGKCQNIHFWLWTHGKNKPDASISLTDTMSERVKEITFNDEHPEEFALTTDYHVLFLTWNGHTLSCDYPKVTIKFRRTGIFNGSCYVPKVQQVFTATTNGCVLIWGKVSCKGKRTIDDDLNCKKKKHIKSVNLQKSSITVIADNEGMLVTGNSKGRITFYDYQLRLLYWCQSCDLDSIRWISFDLQSNLLAPIFASDASEKYEQDDKAQIVISSKLTVSVEHTSDRSSKVMDKTVNGARSSYLPTDATIHGSPFNVRKFLACSSAGKTALIEIAKQKCHLVLHPLATVTSVDAHPESNYVIMGDAQGTVHLYNYEKRILITSKSTPSLPDFRSILEKQVADESIIYVTCPQSHESLKAVTALKFSPKCDMLACGLENGTIWILHYVTLDPLDVLPYKHSSAAINKIVFTADAEYMAYADDALTVVIFKRNKADSKERNVWNLIGKYHSHYLPIRDILFGPAASDSGIPRFFSLGEDRELVEYDLKHSGPYPVPGLQISRIDQVEQSAVPLCLAWYPKSDAERLLVIANSEYKYKIFGDATKTIRGTYLGPTFGEPVQHFQILADRKSLGVNGYMIFATAREIGLQLLPLDGNPYKFIGITGHPQKITGISVSSNGEIIFTAGYNDPCVLMWKVQLRSVDMMARLGGEGLSPFHRLVEGWKNRRLINEMKDLFNYARMPRRGECTAAAGATSETVLVEQIPNLMRAVGYFPTNKEVENIVAEVCCKRYVETGELVEEITFEEFVRLYVNHRPAFDVLCMRQIKEAFRAFVENSARVETPTLTREQFVNVLLGKAISGTRTEDGKPVGEPLTLQEAHTCLRLLVPRDEETIGARRPSPSRRSFCFLPSRISYKDFATDIVGVGLPEETRADNRGNQRDGRLRYSVL